MDKLKKKYRKIKKKNPYYRQHRQRLDVFFSQVHIDKRVWLPNTATEVTFLAPYIGFQRFTFNVQDLDHGQ